MKKQYITRKGNFDSAHRVMNEKFKCFHIHGHTYLYKLEFEFNEMDEIGYAIDFKEIKRVACQWIDDLLDHGAIVNPKDEIFIESITKLKTKIWYMSLNGEGEYCNPSVENIAKEIFLAMEILFSNYDNLKIHKIVIHETPNCSTKCIKKSISEFEKTNWKNLNEKKVLEYAKEKGILEYDDRI